MDIAYSNSNSKVPKRSSLSPINNFVPLNPYYHHTCSVLDQFASPDHGHTTVSKGLNSPLMRYLRSTRSLMASPSSPGDNPPSTGYKYHRSSSNRSSENSSRLDPPRSPLLFRNATPVKAEEDVLVMDGVLVKTPPADRARSLSSSLTDSGTGSSSSGGKDYKLDLCLSYIENSGFCPYGHKCQFAHGTKGLHPSQFSFKNTLEVPCKNYIATGTCSFGSKCRFLHYETSTTPSPTVATLSPIKLDEPSRIIVTLKSSEWSPLDDDIKIPTSSSNPPLMEDVEDHINKVLYGPRRTKRLPVFDQIYPE